MSEKMWDKAYTMDLSEECYVMSQEKTVKPAKAQGSVCSSVLTLCTSSPQSPFHFWGSQWQWEVQ